MKNNYRQQYLSTVTSFFDGRTQYDNETKIGRALPLLDLVPLRAGQHVLDMATGTGIIAIAAAQKVGPTGSVVGVDISAKMLAQAQAKIEVSGLRSIELIEADAENIAFEPGCFDAIFCVSALMYWADIPGALRRWYRWLKPGGMVAFSAWSDQSYATPLIMEVCKRHGIELQNINEPTGTQERCRQLLLTAGFEEIEIVAEQQGSYVQVEQAKQWNGQWFHPTQNPLASLSDEIMAMLKADVAKAVEEQADERGWWSEKEAFYVSGRKPV
ncbi:MAG: class I SAM-dependent methyltransferase [Cyanobacteria bacterium J06648_10]